MSKMIATTMATLFLLSAPDPAVAESFWPACVIPREPQCLTVAESLGEFGDPLVVEACRPAVAAYIDDLREWSDCAALEAALHAKKVAEKFTCLVDGAAWTGVRCYR